MCCWDGQCGRERSTGLRAELAQGAGAGMGRKVMCKHAESHGKHFSSALVARLKQRAGLCLRDAAAHRGLSACPGNSKPQTGVTFQKKLRQDLAKFENAPEVPGPIDVSRLREWLLQEQRKSLTGGERKRRQR